MTILVTADLHFDSLPLNEHRHAWQNELRRFVTQYKVTGVLVLGDVCEHRDNHGARLVNRVVDHFARLAELCPVVIPRGNHDYADATSPFWAFLTRVPGVTWVNTPTTEENVPAAFSEALGRFLILPHTANFRRDWAGLPLKQAKLVFAHATFEGVRGDNGHPLEGGIPLDLFGPQTKVYSGDIHTRQDVGCVTYVGAPYIIRFGDSYKPRVLLLGDGVRSIACHGPQKCLLQFESGQLRNMDCNVGDIVKIEASVTSLSGWPQRRAEIVAWAEHRQLVVHQIKPIIAQHLTLTKRKASALKSDEEAFTAYAKSRKLDAATVRTGQWLMGKV